jgi:ADP-heptose:LPS heptosyltransferase
MNFFIQGSTRIESFNEKEYFYHKGDSVNKEPHILIIRLSAMGDVAMTVPVIRAFVEQHPNTKLTVLSKPFLKPLFKDIPNVSFYAADVKGKHKGFAGLYQLFKELKKLDITHVADFHNVLRSKILRTFFSFTSTKVACIDKGRAEKKALTREQNKIFKPLKTSAQRYADVLASLGFDTLIDNPKPIEQKELTPAMIKVTGKKTSSWIGIAPFAAFEGKVYPLDLMKKVIEDLSKKHTVLLFGGGRKETELLDQFESVYRNTLNIAGKFSFEEELILISHLDIMLSMDSGNAHLSAMQQVATVTLWGVTHPYAGFAPFHQPDHYCMLPDLKKYPKIPCSIYGNKVYEGYENVMQTIDPKSVVNKVESILQKKSL